MMLNLTGSALANDEAVFHALFAEFVECGGIATIVLCMKLFPDDVDIQGAACNLLMILSSHAGSQVAVVVDGGRRALQRAQSHHANDDDIIESSKIALKKLSAVDDTKRCHKCHTMGNGLMQCGRCKKVLYCSRDCQREDYDVHKKLCKLPAYQDKGKK